MIKKYPYHPRLRESRILLKTPKAYNKVNIISILINRYTVYSLIVIFMAVYKKVLNLYIVYFYILKARKFTDKNK